MMIGKCSNLKMLKLTVNKKTKRIRVNLTQLVRRENGERFISE